MASEIFDLNTLDKLQKRIIRGARVGSKNASFSGSMVVSGSESTFPFTEFLIEISENGDIDTAKFIFIENTFTYDLNKKRVYSPLKFVFDKEKSSWIRTSSFTEIGPLTTSEDFLFLKGLDPIQVRFIPSVQIDKEDFTKIGSIVDKVLVNSSSNEISDLSLTPIPYPANHSSLKVKVTKPNESEQTFNFGEDFVVNYSQIPTFLFPSPTFSERTVAFLKFLAELDENQFTINSSFSGTFLITKGTDQIQNALPESELIKVGADEKERNFDYLIDYSTGQVNFTKSVDQETLVKYVFYNNKIFDDGVVIIKGSGDPQNPVFLEEDRLVGGVDYNLNEGTGTIIFNVPFTSQDSIRVTYFVEGEGVTGVKAEKKIIQNGQIRAEKFPILVNSLTITNAIGSSKQKVLIENEDYSVSYKTGNITFLKELENKTVLLDYTPLAKITCILKPTESDPDQFNITIQNDRILVVDSAQFRFKIVNPRVSIRKENPLNPDNVTFSSTISDTSLTKIALKDPVTGNESLYDVTDYTYTDSDKTLKLRTNSQSNKPLLGLNSLVVATYTYTDTKLPYSPIISGTMTMTEGSNFFEVEGADKTNELFSGGLIRVLDRVTDRFFYFILDTVAFNGVDTFCTIKGTFPQDIVNPSLFVSDEAIVFVSITSTFNLAGSKSRSIKFNSNLFETIQTGAILKINDKFVHTVADIFVTESTTIVNIVPPLFEQLTSEDSIVVSDHRIFIEGDTVLPAQNFILTEPSQPVFEVRYLKEGSAVISLVNDTLTVTETLGFVITPYIVDISLYPTVKELTDYLSSFLPNDTFMVTLFNTDPSISWKTKNLIEFEETSLPYAVTINPEIILNGNKLPSDGISFEIENGSVVLSRPLQKNDRIIATYQGRNNLTEDINKLVNVRVKYFTSLPEGTKVKISTEYFNPDQFFVEALREDDYVSNVFFEEIRGSLAQKSGQVGGGVEGTDDKEPLNSDGGLENNYFRLREQEIRIPLFTKIQNYYKDRTKIFGREAQNIVGKKLGNNDVKLLESDVRYSFITETDLTNAVSNDFSVIFPEGHKLTSPLFSKRFSQEIPSFAQAKFKNELGVGKALAGTEDNPDAYLGWDKILTASPMSGDLVRIEGRDTYLRVSSIQDNGRTLIFTSSISDLEEGDYGFFVKFNSKPKYPIWDDSLYIGSKAVSQQNIVGQADLSFGTFRKFVIPIGQNLKMQITLANGSVQPITVANTVRRKTIDSVVEWLSDDTDLSKYFRVTKERAYGSLGARDAIVFRGHIKDVGSNKEVVSFRFLYETSATVAKNLGFAIDTDYTTYFNNTNVDSLVLKERSDEIEQNNKLASILAVYNKLNRRDISYKTSLVSNATTLQVSIPAAKDLIVDSIAQNDLIRIETNASGPITDSFTEASTASTTYNNFNNSIDAAVTANNFYLNTTLNNTFETFVLGFEQKVITRNAANDSIAQNLALSTPKPNLTLIATATEFSDQRILFGDKTKSAIVSVDGNKAVFPFYSVADQLIGDWDTSSGSETVMILSRDALSTSIFTYTVTKVSIVLKKDTTTYTFLFSTYPTILSLVTAINNNTGNNFTASVFGSNGNFPSGGLAETTSNVPIISTVNVASAILQYSPSFSFDFIMGKAFTLSSSGTNPKYQITSTGIILKRDSFPDTTLNFSSYPTVGNLVGAINGISGFSAAFVTAPPNSSYVYGSLGRKAESPISGATNIYLGAKGDITYYQISNKNINQKITDNNNRISAIGDFSNFLNTTRFPKIGDSLEKELLTTNWSTWLNFRMNKETGCNFQKRYIEDQIAKNLTELEQIQDLTA